MRKVVVGTIGAATLLLAGMLSGNAEAGRLTGCCHEKWRLGVRNGLWRSFARASVLRGVASCMANGIALVLRHRTSHLPQGQRVTKTLKSKSCAGGSHPFTIDERDPGFGCTEGNRIFLL